MQSRLLHLHPQTRQKLLRLKQAAECDGAYREARIQQLEDAAPKPLQTIQQKEAIELHLPPIPVYAAIELI